MANLDFHLIQSIERAFQMSGGYVLGLPKKQIIQLFSSTLGIDIMADDYSGQGDSSANRLREYIRKSPESDLVRALAELSKTFEFKKSFEENAHDCQNILDYIELKKETGILSNLMVEDLARRVENHPQLVSQIRHAIDSGQPEAAMDRLHTLVYSYLIKICDEIGIDIYKSPGNKKSMESLAGEYIKLTQGNPNLSEIIKDNLKPLAVRLSILNRVRNKSSLAHVLPLLSKENADIILDSISVELKNLSYTHKQLGLVSV